MTPKLPNLYCHLFLVYIMDIRLLHRLQQDDSADTTSSSNLSGWLDHYRDNRNNGGNLTAVGDDELETYQSDPGTVLVLTFILFILVTGAMACMYMDKARKDSTANIASDGETVASKDDGDGDVEEGRNKDADFPVIVVVNDTG